MVDSRKSHRFCVCAARDGACGMCFLVMANVCCLAGGRKICCNSAATLSSGDRAHALNDDVMYHAGKTAMLINTAGLATLSLPLILYLLY